MVIGGGVLGVGWGRRGGEVFEVCFWCDVEEPGSA